MHADEIITLSLNFKREFGIGQFVVKIVHNFLFSHKNHTIPSSVQTRRVLMWVLKSVQSSLSELLKPGFHYTANATTTTQKQSNYRVE